MVVYNSTGSIGVALEYMTLNITGSLFLTFLTILILYLVVLIMFKVPFELAIPLSLPLLIMFAIIDAGFLKILGLILIMGSAFLVNKFFLNR